jgi:hypothetical protein
MKEFITHILSIRNTFVSVNLNYKDLSEIEGSVLKSLKLENIFQLNDRYDGVSFLNSFTRKVSGVIVLEKLLDIELLNWEKIKPSIYKPIITLEGKKIEVITFETGAFPIIPIVNKEPKLIVLMNANRKFWVCGFATKKVLNEHQDSNLLDDYLTKDITAFTGFKYLNKFNNYSELMTLISPKSK